jgi:hypothetical protein
MTVANEPARLNHPRHPDRSPQAKWRDLSFEYGTLDLTAFRSNPENQPLGAPAGVMFWLKRKTLFGS